MRSQNFQKNLHFLPPGMHSYLCVSGIKKCQIFGKFCEPSKWMIPSWRRTIYQIAEKERRPYLFLSNIYIQCMHRRRLPDILIAVGAIASCYWMIFIYLWESALIVEKKSCVPCAFLAEVFLTTVLDSLVKAI